jgi:hypothetical protein
MRKMALVVILALAAPTAALAQTKAAPVAAQKSAKKYAGGVYGGQWSATTIGHTAKGDAKVVVRSKSTARRWMGGKAAGMFTVGADGAVKGHSMRVGILPRFASMIWNSGPLMAIRTNSKIMTVIAGGLATLAAAKLGVSYEAALTVIAPTTAAILAGEFRTEAKMRSAADKITNVMLEESSGGGGQKVRTVAAQEESFEGRHMTRTTANVEAIKKIRAILGAK